MRKENEKNPYASIMGRQRMEPVRPRMNLLDRAKIFSPFAALTGHQEAIAAMEVSRVNKRILSDTEKEKICKEAQLLKKGDRIACVYFVKDPGPDGSGGLAEGYYVTRKGIVQKMDSIGQNLYISDESGLQWCCAVGDLIELHAGNCERS